MLAWRSIETSCLLEEEEATTSMHSFVEMEIINGKAIFFWPLILPSPCIRTAISSSWKSTVASGHCCFQCPDFVFVFFKPKKKNKCCLQSHSVFLDIKEHAALYLYTDQMDTFQGSLYPKNKSKKRIISGMCVQQCIFDLLPQYNIY